LEKGNPYEDVAPGLTMLGPFLKRFTSVTTTYEPVLDGIAYRYFISKSFDATSHFASDCDHLLSLYKRVSGEELDMNINADSVEGDY
jgi:Rab GDP dissociation inhibitor